MIIPEQRKCILRAMAKDADVAKLHDGIALCKKNKEIFRAALDKEDINIAEFEYMLQIKDALG